MVNRISPLHWLLLSAGLLTACASPTAMQPAARPLDASGYGQDAAAVPDAATQGAWWRALHIAELDQLIDDARRQHPSLTEAQARIRAATASVRLTAAGAGPQIDANAGTERARESEYGLLPPPIGGSWYSLHALSVDMGWRLDLWGRIRSQTASAEARRLAARLEYQASEQWLASAITAQYLELAGSRLQADAARQELDLARQQARQAASLLRSGLVTADVPDSLHADQLALESRITQLQAREQTAAHALAALSAQPQDRIDRLQARQLPDWSFDSATLTTRALSARPDVQAALAYVRASEHSVDAAKAAFYPDLTLGAFIGLQAQNTADLFSRAGSIAGIMPGISLPLFHAGALNAELDAQSAGRDAAIARYNQTLLTAIREAADGVSQTQAARQLWQQAQSRHTTLAQLARRSQSRTRSGLAAPMQALADARQASAAWQQHLAAQTSTLLAQTALMRALAVPAPL
ncbi:efflux transporter outer membrane subunit [Laribacter hongkongensis]|uniref:efflux transporter outer membrane subunit n=1 Tax=Laribacter hongkongensis TaxID=168471 RepID=UPI001EFD1AB1|nr:efflux transporter outer membrane subunit [Laribacter hongkongensis]MCG9030821.1 efflux transporter outer membrane subunit [Laribacter hongkongensis]MCG9057408.1 efflux transporter outer membrane subunit [Laribacter hongkongensis]MCG9084724.1 efflux transporter outer membrane subunit [Laribacter hongkongensis]MCG9091313.1 efflux transporter outer membrane subunit [Laribacter hongkongensis]